MTRERNITSGTSSGALSGLQCTPYRTEQGAACPGQKRPGQEQHGGQRMDRHEQQRTRGTSLLNLLLQDNRFEPVPLNEGEADSCRQQDQQQPAQPLILHQRHSIVGD